MAFLTHDVLANLTHITIYSPTISLLLTLIVKTGLDTIWPLNSFQIVVKFNKIWNCKCIFLNFPACF